MSNFSPPSDRFRALAQRLYVEKPGAGLCYEAMDSLSAAADRIDALEKELIAMRMAFAERGGVLEAAR